VHLGINSFAPTILSTTPKIENAESGAEVRYRTGLAYLEDENFIEAEKEFMLVITDYSFSKYESLAHIGLGDTYLKKEEYAAAVEVFKRFIKMRPGHPKSDYALFQIGNSHYLQKPSDFILLPDPSEKDLQTIKEAVSYYKVYLKRYPKGEFVSKVKANLEEAHFLLVSKEFKVAEYYLSQGQCSGVISRVEYIQKNYDMKSDRVKQKLAELLKECPKPQETAKDPKPESVKEDVKPTS